MSDDNSPCTKFGQSTSFTIFILCIIVYANVNTAILYKEGCVQGKEFEYIKYALFGAIVQLCAIVLLTFSLCSEKYGRHIQVLAGLMLIGGWINQLVWLGFLWDSYPADYLVFYEKFWTTIRAGCVEESNKWVYIMMDVIIKIVGGFTIFFLIILALKICCCPPITSKRETDLSEICTV